MKFVRYFSVKDDYYFDGGNSCAVPLPIRWLAPESVLIDGDVIALRKITKESNLWCVLFSVSVLMNCIMLLCVDNTFQANG